MSSLSFFRRSIPLAAILVILSGFFTPLTHVQAGQETPPTGSLPPEWEVTINGDTGKVRLMSAGSDTPLLNGEIMAQGAGEEDLARQFLAQFGAEFGLSAAAEMPVEKITTAEDGSQWLHFAQTYNGLPVAGAQVVVQVSPNFDVLSARSDVSVDLSLSTTPAISAARAKELAFERTIEDLHVKSEEIVAGEAQLLIYDSLVFGRPGAPIKRLAWQVEVKPLAEESPLPVNVLALIDAQNGRFLEFINRVDNALNRNVYDCGGKDMNTANCNLVRIEGGSASGIDDADKAYAYFGNVYNFYKDILGRDSINGHGMKIIGYTNVSEKGSVLANAFWTGKVMIFGADTADAADVVGHELTHGVTDYESNLIYAYQSGAIDEHFSDFWGELIELYYDPVDAANPAKRWWIGDDTGSGNPGMMYIRNMANPPDRSQPDQVDGTDYDCGLDDNGGVHNNNGVGNKAAFLALDGVESPGFNGYIINPISPDGGIGSTNDQKKISKLAKIWYYAQANILTPAADWIALNDALNSACSALKDKKGSSISASDCTTVQQALLAVEANTRPCLGYYSPQYLSPDKPVPYAPKGAQTRTPTVIEWKHVANFQATQYRVEMKGPTGWLIKNQPPVSVADACTGVSTCTVKIPPPVVYGAYTWRVQAINALGSSAWSAWTSFKVNTPANPIDVITPTVAGSDSARPFFSWPDYTSTTVSAYQYRLGTQKAGAKVRYSPWYRFDTLDCASGTCSRQFPLSLTTGVYRAFVQGKAGGKTTSLGDGVAFTLDALPDVVGGLVSPAGDNASPAYTWGDTINTTAYNLQISGPSGKYQRQVSKAEAVCNGSTCTYTPTTYLLTGGKHQWRVQSQNGIGAAAWSAWSIFTVAKPGQVNGGFAPKDTNPGNNRPLFQWNPVAGNLARRYNIIVKNAANKVVLNQWANSDGSSGVCSASLCQVEAAKLFPLAGAYTWSVTGWNKAGLGDASEAQNFTLDAAGVAPNAPLPVYPAANARLASDAISIRFDRPITSTDSVTHYRIQVYSYRTRAYITGSLDYRTPAALGCSEDTSCEYVIGSLPEGKYRWQVQAFNKGFNQSRSNAPARIFTAVLPAPTLHSANGGDYKQVFTWDQNRLATKYTLTIRKDSAGGSVIFNKTYIASAICNGSLCSVDSLPALPDGVTYHWQVSAWEPKTGNSLPANSSFSDNSLKSWHFIAGGDKNDWIDPYFPPYTPSSWTINTEKPGLYYNLPASYDNETWLKSSAFSGSDFDYQVYLKVTDPSTDKEQDASVVVRASLDSYDLVLEGIGFSINNKGSYSVQQIYYDAGSGTLNHPAIQPYTSSTYIKPNDYNLLRVLGKDDDLYFYINDKLVWYYENFTTYLDSSHTRVGLFSWSPNYPVYVDYVSFYGVPDIVPMSAGMIDAHQALLNDLTLSVNANSIETDAIAVQRPK